VCVTSFFRTAHYPGRSMSAVGTTESFTYLLSRAVHLANRDRCSVPALQLYGASPCMNAVGAAGTCSGGTRRESGVYDPGTQRLSARCRVTARPTNAAQRPRAAVSTSAFPCQPRPAPSIKTATLPCNRAGLSRSSIARAIPAPVGPTPNAPCANKRRLRSGRHLWSESLHRAARPDGQICPPAVCDAGSSLRGDRASRRSRTTATSDAAGGPE